MGVTAGRRASGRAGETPLRTCAVTRAQRPQDELIRFVAAPDGSIVPDLSCRLPGRGVWVSNDRDAVAAAVRTKAFGRSLKLDVRADAGLPGLVERLLIERAAHALSLANKAGLVVAGHAKVEAMIAAGVAVVLVHGSDAASDGAARLDRQFAAMSRDARREPRVVRDLPIDQLSLALGRSNVVHAALKTGGAAELFVSEAERLRRFKTGKTDGAGSGRAEARPPE